VANLHGGFIMGLATLGCFSAAVLVQDFVAGWECIAECGSSRSRLPRCRYAGHPFGLGGWQAVIHAFQNRHTHTEIVDCSRCGLDPIHWQSHQMGSVAMKLLGAAMFALLERC